MKIEVSVKVLGGTYGGSTLVESSRTQVVDDDYRAARARLADMVGEAHDEAEARLRHLARAAAEGDDG